MVWLCCDWDLEFDILSDVDLVAIEFQCVLSHLVQVEQIFKILK